MTGGNEGSVKWWDTRNLSSPTHQMLVDSENKDLNCPGLEERALSVSCLEYEPTIPAKFMVGTDQGKALGCTRKAKCQAEYILNIFDAHYGPVRALQRNPSYSKVGPRIEQWSPMLLFSIKNFLTVGDWSARVWSEDISESCLFWVNSGTEVSFTSVQYYSRYYSLSLLSDAH